MFEALCDEGTIYIFSDPFIYISQNVLYVSDLSNYIMFVKYMINKSLNQGTIYLKPYVMKVNKQKVIQILFQPKKKTENTWKCPHPTNRVPIFNCSCF